MHVQPPLCSGIYTDVVPGIYWPGSPSVSVTIFSDMYKSHGGIVSYYCGYGDVSCSAWPIHRFLSPITVSNNNVPLSLVIVSYGWTQLRVCTHTWQGSLILAGFGELNLTVDCEINTDFT